MTPKTAPPLGVLKHGIGYDLVVNRETGDRGPGQIA